MKPAYAHKGRFNKPTTGEVAVLMAGQHFERRDILLHTTDHGIRRISETHVAYDALQYPLLFPRGEDMYSIDIPLRSPGTGHLQPKKVSALQFYAYYLMDRAHSNHLLRTRSLLCQYVVDQYAKIESERLLYIRNIQKKLRADDYVHLQDALGKEDVDPTALGKIVILPASYTGSPRYLQQRTQDAMAYVRQFGRPDLFITFTCNPQWPEVINNLFPRQRAHDRPDLLSRVFRQKLKALMAFLTKGQAFGPVSCYMYTVE